MGKIICTKENISRHNLASPFSKETLHGRLVQVKTVDLRNNHTFDVLENGYCRIKPINKNKLMK